ncbi:MAG: DUF6051 family protein [Porphyromonadaceae bacterium]|nr:DUF6051 family protein [Porphyromonadaceae bacterium]
MNYNERYIALNNCFRQGTESHLKESGIDVRFFRFRSMLCDDEKESPTQVLSISENFAFDYPVFLPTGSDHHEKAILLLHGLNERSWNKYLPWAEFLAIQTGRPVILFPIAFHINRSPQAWSNPRSLTDLLTFRRHQYGDDRSVSFANVALSNRISRNPERFYLSGRQTWADLNRLFEEIKSGCHPLFKEGCHIDILAYSIGAFLSQIALMANERNFFTDSRLFMFCGGSIFRSMYGISRSIMDKAAFTRLQDYYIYQFGNELEERWKHDNAFKAFFRMILPGRLKEEREDFFAHIRNRISGVALEKDSVIPYHGVQEALGYETTEATISLLDFPFEYTHENPFPLQTKDQCALNNAFTNIFSRVVSFFA